VTSPARHRVAAPHPDRRQTGGRLRHDPSDRPVPGRDRDRTSHRRIRRTRSATRSPTSSPAV